MRQQTILEDGRVELRQGERVLIVEAHKVQSAAADFFEPDPIPVPAFVTARQARLALLASDLLDAVEDALQALTGPEGRAARVEWEFATTIRRDSPLIAALAPVVGLSESEVDELFVMGAGL